MTLFTRTAYQLKNSTQSVVVQTLEIARALKQVDPDSWNYARVTPVQVSWFRPGFGVVTMLKARSARAPSTPSETTVNVANIVETPRKRGRPTNAERAARLAAEAGVVTVPARGIAPANVTEASSSDSAPSSPVA